MTRPRLRGPMVLLLTVLLVGVGVTGAVAAWSQQAKVSATVTTGIWVEPTPPPGWRWDPQVEVVPDADVTQDLDYTFTFTTVEGMEAATYTISVDPQGQVKDGPTHEVVGDKLSVWVRMKSTGASKSATLTIIATTASGVASAPVIQTFTYGSDGSVTLG